MRTQDFVRDLSRQNHFSAHHRSRSGFKPEMCNWCSLLQTFPATEQKGLYKMPTCNALCLWSTNGVAQEGYTTSALFKYLLHTNKTRWIGLRRNRDVHVKKACRIWPYVWKFIAYLRYSIKEYDFGQHSKHLGVNSFQNSTSSKDICFLQRGFTYARKSSCCTLHVPIFWIFQGLLLSLTSS